MKRAEAGFCSLRGHLVVLCRLQFVFRTVIGKDNGWIHGYAAIRS